MPKVVRFILKFIFVFIFLLCFNKNAAAFQNSEINQLPIYIKLETEDLAGVSAQDSKSVWQQYMAWYPHWSRGGASGWWSVKAAPTVEKSEISKEIYVPQDGNYSIWVRYQDYTNKAEPFNITFNQDNNNAQMEFGLSEIITKSDSQISWNYAWEKKSVNLKKGLAKVRILVNQTAEVARAVDALILTNDINWIPQERGFPPQAYSNYLLKWAETRAPLKPLIENKEKSPVIPKEWALPKTSARDFWYLGATELIADFPFPVNIRPEITNPNTAKKFTKVYAQKPETAPIFGSPLTTLQVSVAKVGELLKTENSLRRYIIEKKIPFVLVGNYSSAGKIPGSYQKLSEIFGNQWIGTVSGENTYLEIPLHPEKNPAEQDFKNRNYEWLLADGKKQFQQKMETDWASPIPNAFEKIIPALSVGNLPHAHQFAETGVSTLAAESAGASPYVPLKMAFVRGAARQYQKPWMWYFGASFGDAIRTFTEEERYELELEGLKINNRSAEIGPSLAHIRRSLLFSYLQGANFLLPEQGYNLFDTGGKLNPMGWSYDEMIRLAAKRPLRGAINTPIAVLLDKSHGWDKYTYNGMRLWNAQPLSRADQMINQFFNVAYFPFPKNEGEFVNDLNVPFPNGYFGDIFDVLVTSPTAMDSLKAYPAVFCVGDTRLNPKWSEHLKKYVSEGGTLVINAEQVTAAFDENFLGVKLEDVRKESDTAVCERDGEKLSGTPFQYQKAAATSSARIIARASNGDPLAFVNKIGKGQVILTTPSYLMGHDEVAMPYLAHLLLELASGLQPIDVRGNCEYFINLRPDGYVLTLSNNEGLAKMSHSPAVMDMSKTAEITLRIKNKPLKTEDWLGEDPRPWNFPNEWLPEYTQPKTLSWQPDGNQYQATVKLLPGEIRVFFIKTAGLKAA